MPVMTAAAASSVEIFIFHTLPFNHQYLRWLSVPEYDFQANDGQAEDSINAGHYAKYRREMGYEGLIISNKSKKNGTPKGTVYVRYRQTFMFRPKP
jgi:hypothetical protein